MGRASVGPVRRRQSADNGGGSPDSIPTQRIPIRTEDLLKDIDMPDPSDQLVQSHELMETILSTDGGAIW